MNQKSLQPYMSRKLVLGLQTPIEFALSKEHFFNQRGAILPLGYEAWVLPELCNAILDAYEADALRSSQP